MTKILLMRKDHPASLHYSTLGVCVNLWCRQDVISMRLMRRIHRIRHEAECIMR